ARGPGGHGRGRGRRNPPRAGSRRRLAWTSVPALPLWNSNGLELVSAAGLQAIEVPALLHLRARRQKLVDEAAVLGMDSISVDVLHRSEPHDDDDVPRLLGLGIGGGAPPAPPPPPDRPPPRPPALDRPPAPPP